METKKEFKPMEQKTITVESLKQGFENGTYKGGYQVFNEGEEVKVILPTKRVYKSCSGVSKSGNDYNFPVVMIEKATFTQAETETKIGSLASIDYISLNKGLLNHLEETNPTELNLIAEGYTTSDGERKVSLKPVLVG